MSLNISDLFNDIKDKYLILIMNFNKSFSNLYTLLITNPKNSGKGYCIRNSLNFLSTKSASLSLKLMNENSLIISIFQTSHNLPSISFT